MVATLSMEDRVSRDRLEPRAMGHPMRGHIYLHQNGKDGRLSNTRHHRCLSTHGMTLGLERLVPARATNQRGLTPHQPPWRQ